MFISPSSAAFSGRKENLFLLASHPNGQYPEGVLIIRNKVLKMILSRSGSRCHFHHAKMKSQNEIGRAAPGRLAEVIAQGCPRKIKDGFAQRYTLQFQQWLSRRKHN